MSQSTSRALAPIEAFKSQLARSRGEFAAALPPHISPEKFQRVALTVASQSPELLNADRKSLLGACVKCAQDGLIPDGREAALVMFGGKVQYMPMMAGLLKRARNTSEIASISAHVVYAGDAFGIEYGDEERLTHKPLLDGDRGKPIGAYAIARLKDGSVMREWMSVAEIEKVRQVSRAKGAGPWVQWWDEMARKTVFRRLSKWLPTDAEDSKLKSVQSLAERDDRLGAPEGDADASPIIEGDAVDLTPSRLDAIEGGLTGEVITFAIKTPGGQIEYPTIAVWEAEWLKIIAAEPAANLKKAREMNGALMGEYAEDHGDVVMRVQNAIEAKGAAA